MREVLTLAGFAGAAALLLGTLNLVTAPRIHAAREAAQFAHLVALTGTNGPFEVHDRAGNVALVHNAAAPDQQVVLVFADGYGGPIEIAVVLDADGAVAALTTLHHRETPGLGDFIDVQRSNWSETVHRPPQRQRR